MSAARSTSAARPTIGVITCAEMPEPDLDQELLLDALGDRGLDARLMAWDDAAQDPGSCELCVLRSAWNYHLAPEAFGRWIERAAARTRLLNPAPILRWNLHKGYLRELEADGVPVVPTAWAGRGQELDVSALAGEHGWREVVLKPAVSAGSHETRRFHAADPEASAFLRHLTTAGDAMVQPFVESVEERGERALVWIDGRFTHAVRKSTRYAGEEEAVSEALPLEPAELELGQRVLARVLHELGGDLLYARIDLMESASGELLLSELELLEPSLFLLQAPAALGRLVEGIAARIQGERAT
jgi:glutathione synthase/RimK-type ligase-like ATP-grasp enzyme